MSKKHFEYSKDEIKAPTNGWEVGQIARSTGTGEVGSVVRIDWDRLWIEIGGDPPRRIAFPVRFMEKVDDGV